MNESHPYNESWPIPEGTCLLIIGTAPPPRFSQPRRACLSILPEDVDFYYGSKNNYLWSEILRELYQLNFSRSRDESRTVMVEFLAKHKIWMRDILQVYRRRECRKKSASDNDIILREKYTDFRPIFAQYQTIDTVIFTGRCAEKWTGQQLELRQLSYPSPGSQIPRHSTISLDGRSIDFHTLPSPSPGNWLYSIEDMRKLYKNVLLKRCPIK